MVAQTPDAIAVKVIGPDYVDYAMVSFGGPADEKRELTLAQPASGERFVFRDYAYLRCRGGSVVGRGGLISFDIRDSGMGTSPILQGCTSVRCKIKPPRHSPRAAVLDRRQQWSLRRLDHLLTHHVIVCAFPCDRRISKAVKNSQLAGVFESLPLDDL